MVHWSLFGAVGVPRTCTFPPLVSSRHSHAARPAGVARWHGVGGFDEERGGRVGTGGGTNIEGRGQCAVPLGITRTPGSSGMAMAELRV